MRARALTIIIIINVGLSFGQGFRFINRGVRGLLRWSLFLTDILFVDVAVHSRILGCIKLGLNCHESAGIKSVENWPDHVVGEQKLLLFLSCHEMTGLEEMCLH